MKNRDVVKQFAEIFQKGIFHYARLQAPRDNEEQNTVMLLSKKHNTLAIIRAHE